MLLASYFFSARLHFRSIDPLKRGRGPVVSVIFFYVMALPFFAEFRDGSYGLNTKRSSMEHPQCTCGRLVMPGLQMLTPQRDGRVSSGPVDPGVWGISTLIP